MLIAMAVYDTEENQRTGMTRKTLVSLSETVDFDRHHLIIVDNGSCDITQELFIDAQQLLPFRLIQYRKNFGTAAAINTAWRFRKKSEHCVKMDNDVVIRNSGWADLMEYVFAKEPDIGICGLKRKDLAEHPGAEQDFYKSKLSFLKHEPGERWIPIEDVLHVMGTCQAYSAALLEKIGYLYQMQDLGNLYGFDDSLASYRAELLGFRRVFLPHIEIDHIDPGATEFTDWKRRQAGKWMKEFHQVKREYKDGTRDIYYPGP